MMIVLMADEIDWVSYTSDYELDEKTPSLPDTPYTGNSLINCEVIKKSAERNLNKSALDANIAFVLSY